MHVLDQRAAGVGPAEQLERGVHGVEQPGAVEAALASGVGGGALPGSSRRPGISRATAGPASTSGGPAAGGSVARRPNTSLNGR